MKIQLILRKAIQLFLCCFMGSMAHHAYADKLITSGDTLVYVSNCYFYYYDVVDQYWPMANIYNNEGKPMSTFCHPSGGTGLNMGNIVDVVSNNKGGLVAIEQKENTVYLSANNAWYSTDNGATWNTQYPNEGDAGGCTQCFPLAPSKIFYVNENFLAGGFTTTPWLSSDGSTWNPTKLTDSSSLVGYSTALAYNGNNIIQLYSEGIGAKNYLISSDGGNTWSGGAFPNADTALYYDIAYFHDPTNTSVNTLMPFKDPVRAAAEVQVESSICQNTPVNPTANPGVFIAVGDYSDVLYSTDGKNFCYTTGLQNDSDLSIYKVAYNSVFHHWIAVGQEGSAFYSSNGYLWSTSSLYKYNYAEFDLIAINDKGITLVTEKIDPTRNWYSGYCMHYSEDGGATWTESTFCQTPYSMVWHKPTQQFYIATPSPDDSIVPEGTDPCEVKYPDLFKDATTICTSTDGKQWTKITGLPPGT